ncbi:MAG: alpha/beta hydrolase [Ilumatobacter sp.]|uniref:alpha/beta fold hydrolase n=1 Tax=Ilumatobacter sp. TaxID=1967498 RepID=UPI00329A76BA
MLPPGCRSRVVSVAGTRIHVVEAGTGPLVLLVHGFPESWYSWRHQLTALAAAGHQVVAIDVRGYGRSSAPLDVSEYRMVRLVADNVGLVSALGHDTAVVVGHDWGAPIAWTSALLRPDVFTAVAGLSVPYTPPSEHRPLAMMRALAGDEEFYIEYFQEPGRAEAEIEADVRGWLHGFMFSASGDAPPLEPGAGTIGTIPHGAQMRDRFAWPESEPAWLTDDDLDVYANEFEHTGFRGALNRYRNVDRDWEDLAAWRGAPIEVPALFIGGDRDGPTILGAPAIDAFGTTLPRLHRSVILEGCGHWTQQERPVEVGDALLDFLGSLS